jgi:hypothetical protein
MAANPPHLESSRTEVVLVGSFQPNDAMPEKLVEAETISRNEAKAVTFKSLLSGQIVDIDLGWGSLQVVPQRVVVITSKAPYVRAADLALRIARDGSRPAVVTMFGINREFHYKFASSKDRDAFGVRLAPPSAWGTWGDSLAAEMEDASLDPKQHSGLLSMTMRRMHMPNREGGWLDLSVTATGSSVEEAAVSVRANDHYQFDPDKDPETLSADSHAASRTLRLLDSLASNFDESIKRSDAIVAGFITI